MLFGNYIYVTLIICCGSCPIFARRDRGELPKIEQFGLILEKRTTVCTSNDHVPLPPPRPTNVLVKQHLGVAEPGMTQDSGIFAKSTRFGCTLGLLHAHWHISWDSVGHNSLDTRYFRDINISAYSLGPQLQVDMLVIAIWQGSRKLHRLKVLTYIS